MKKKILKIASIVMLVVLLAAISAVGTFFLIRNKNVEETGNVFGISWYNETDPQFVITTAEQLYEFAQLSDYYSFKKQTVKLGADIVVNEGNASDWAKDRPKLRWTPIKNFSGIFDGQGHTISGIYGKSNGSKMALFIDAEANCSIKNVKLVNSYFETSGGRGVASFVSGGGGKLTKLYSDAIFYHKGEYCGGIASKIAKQTTFDQCWFDGKIDLTEGYAGGIVDLVSGGRVTMNHCLFSGEIDQKYSFSKARAGGIAGCVMRPSTVIISDSLACGKLSVDTEVEAGSLFGVSDSNTNYTITNSYVSRGTYDLLVGAQGGNYTGTAIALHEKDLQGMKAYQRTMLDFTRYWTVTEDSTPVLKCFADTVPSLEGVAKDYDTDWYIKGNYNFEITTREQLYGLMLLSASNDFTDVVFTLGADIVMNEGKAENWAKKAPELSWYGIRSFKGTFDGQGHTISGIYLSEEDLFAGFFSSVLPEGDVENFRLTNSYFESTTEVYAMMGSVIGDLRGNLRNVYSNAYVVAHGDQVGGIVGRVYDNDNIGNPDDIVEISNCWYDGKVYVARNGVKGAAGILAWQTAGDINIAHCLNTGTIESETDDRGVHLGGILGNAMQKGTINITDCLNTGKLIVKRDTCVGAVIGRGWSDKATINVTNSYASYESYHRGIGNNTASTVNGGVVVLPESMLTGFEAYKFTELDFPNYWAIVKTGTPILQHYTNSDPSTAGIKKMMNTKWYKADAKTLTIKTVDELYGLFAVSAGTDFKGQTIKLGADIVVNPVDAATLTAWKNGSAVAANQWIPISSVYYKGFAGTFDGQGHSVSGLYMKTDWDFSGFFSSIAPEGVVKNFSIKDSYFCNTKKTYAMFGSVVGDHRGTMQNVYSNAIVEAYGGQVGGIAGRVYDNDVDEGYAKDDIVQITDCWFDGEVSSLRNGVMGVAGIVGWLTNGDLNVARCLNTGTISSITDNSGVHLGGIIGAAKGQGKLTIANCLSTGELIVVKDVCVGGVLGRGWSEQLSINISDSYASHESYYRGVGSNTDSKVSGGVLVLPESMLTGTEAYKYTQLDFDKTWAVVEGGTPLLKSFSGNGAGTGNVKRLINADWYKANAKTLIIDSVEDLYAFLDASAGTTFKGQTVKLGADIVVNKVDEATLSAWRDGSKVAENLWVPASSVYDKSFAGTLDGQGHSIKGLYLSTDWSFSGFLSSIAPDGVVKNFRMEDGYFYNTNQSNAMMGSVVGDLRGKVQNVYSNATIISYGSQAAGIAGRTYDVDSANDSNKEDKVEVSGCWFDGELYMAKNGIMHGAGMVGRLTAGDLIISNCLNTGTIKSETDDRGVHVGGIFGTAYGKGILEVTDCLNAGDFVVKRDLCVGSVIGRGWDKTVTIKVKNTYTTEESFMRGIGNALESKLIGDVIRMPEQYYLGTECYKWSLLDYEKYWSARKNDTPSLKYFEDQKLKKDGVVADTSWYDADDKKLYIKDIQDFYGFSTLVRNGEDFKGQTVYLDVKNDELKMDKDSSWLPIGTDSSPFYGTFDGKNATITGLNINASSGTDIGLFGVTGEGSLLQNFSLKDSKITYSSEQSKNEHFIAGIGSVCGTLGGDLKNVYSNTDIESTAAYVGGLVGFAKDSSIENCWYDGKLQLRGEYATYGGGIIAVANGGNVTIEQCLNTGNISNEKTTAAQFLGAIIGADSSASEILIKDTIAAGTVTAKRYVGASAIVGLTYKKGTTYTFDNVYTTTNCCPRTTTVATSYGTSEATVKNTDEITIMQEKYYYGVEGYRWTTLDFGNEKWAARGGKVPAPETFVSDAQSVNGVIRPDYSWAETEPYQIKDEADFYGFTKLVQEGNSFEGKTIYLKADLDMNTVDRQDGKKTVKAWMDGTEVPKNLWMPIGYDDASNNPPIFKGRFTGLDGDKIHSISGIYVDGNSRSQGLFGRVGDTAQIDNLILKNSYVHNTNARTGAIVGWMEGTLSNICVEPSVIVKGEGKDSLAVGGLVGFAYKKHTTDFAKNCWFAGDVHATGQSTGGFVGWVYAADIKFSDCLFTGNVYSTYTSSASDYANTSRTGGFIGLMNEYSNITFANCVGNGYVSVKHAAGAGAVFGTVGSGTITMSNVYTNDNCEGDSGATSGCSAQSISAASSFKGLPATLSVDEMKGKQAYIHTQLLLRGSSEDKDEKATWLTTANGPELVTFSKEKPQELTGQRINTAWYYNSWTKDAGAKTYIINDVASMYALPRLVNDKGVTFENDTIYLGANLDMNNGWTPTVDAAGKVNNLPNDVKVWAAVGKQNGTQFKGTFDGQGYTISGIYLPATSAYGTGLFGCINSPNAAVKNLRFVNSYIETAYNHVGSIVGWTLNAKIQNVYSNATIYRSTGIRTGGLVGHFDNAAGNLTIESCWYDGNMKVNSSSGEQAHGGIVGYARAGLTTIDTCLYTGKLDVTYTGSASTLNLYVGGLVGETWAGSLVVKNTLAAGGLDVTWTNSNGNHSLNRVGIISGNTYLDKTKIENTYEVMQARYKVVKKSDAWNKVTYPAGQTPTTGSVVSVDTSFENDVSEIYGEAAVSKLVNLKFSRESGDTTSPIWKVRTGTLPIPETLSRSTTADMSWYDVNATEYKLEDAADMYGLTKLVAAGNTFEGKTIKLTSDLQMNPMDANTLQAWIDGTAVPENFWTPIGLQNGTQFKGVFDGQGHKISGIYVSTNSHYGSGLFGSISGVNAAIKNLRLEDSYIKSTHNQSATIVGWPIGGTIQNVYSNAVLHSTGTNTGGLVAYFDNSSATLKVENCWFDGVVKGGSSTGGLMGYSRYGTTIIDTCLFTGHVEANFTSSSPTQSALNIYVGGLCAQNWYGTLIITDCIAAGSLDFTWKNSANNANINKLGTVCGNHLASTRVHNTYDIMQGRYKIVNKSSEWVDIVNPGGEVQVSGSVLDINGGDNSFKNDFKTNPEKFYGEAGSAKFSKLKFTRPTGDTTSLIWKWRKDALPIPEGLSTFCK